MKIFPLPGRFAGDGLELSGKIAAIGNAYALAYNGEWRLRFFQNLPFGVFYSKRCPPGTEVLILMMKIAGKSPGSDADTLRNLLLVCVRHPVALAMHPFLDKRFCMCEIFG